MERVHGCSIADNKEYFFECTDKYNVTEIRHSCVGANSWILINHKWKSQLNHTSSGTGLFVLTENSSGEEDPVALMAGIAGTASWPWGAALFCRAGLFSLLLGLTFATVGESLPWVGVSGGLGWCVLLGAVWMRCTVTGEEGTGSE